MPNTATTAEPVLHVTATPYESAICPLPSCDGELYLMFEGGSPISAGDTSDTLGLAASAPNFLTWKVECQHGHVLLVPTDVTDAEVRVFGRCDCSDFEDEGVHFGLCGVFDLDRLRKVSGVGKVDGDPI
jgi:hypothetical protein